MLCPDSDCQEPSTARMGMLANGGGHLLIASNDPHSPGNLAGTRNEETQDAEEE